MHLLGPVGIPTGHRVGYCRERPGDLISKDPIWWLLGSMPHRHGFRVGLPVGMTRELLSLASNSIWFSRTDPFL
jgi:hypothetical protein